MFKKIIRKTKLLLVLPDYMRSKNTVVAKKSQLFWGLSLANKVCRASELQDLPTGSILYFKLSPEFKAFVAYKKWDPYQKDMYNRQIRKWLWNHVVFDGFGQIIAIHDQGKILYCANTWDKEVGLFSKIWT